MDKHLLMWDFKILPNTGSSPEKLTQPSHGLREQAQVGANIMFSISDICFFLQPASLKYE